jgi:hypothetical protein
MSVDRFFLFNFLFFTYLCGATLGTAATIGLMYQPRMIVEGDCGEIGGMKISRGNRSTREKTCLSATLSYHKSHMTRPCFEPGPATNRFSYGAAFCGPLQNHTASQSRRSYSTQSQIVKFNCCFTGILDNSHRPIFYTSLKGTTCQKLGLFPSSGEGVGETPILLSPLERIDLTRGRKKIQSPKRCVLQNSGRETKSKKLQCYTPSI